MTQTQDIDAIRALIRCQEIRKSAARAISEYHAGIRSRTQALQRVKERARRTALADLRRNLSPAELAACPPDRARNLQEITHLDVFLMRLNLEEWAKENYLEESIPALPTRPDALAEDLAFLVTAKNGTDPEVRRVAARVESELIQQMAANNLGSPADKG